MDGNKLKELRESKYLSRDEFADRIGVDTDEVENWEEYGYEPSKYNIGRIANVLNVDEDSLKWKLNVDRKIDEEETPDIGLGGLLLGIAAIWGLGKLTNRNKNNENDYEEFNDEDEEKEDNEEINLCNENETIRNKYGTVTIENKRKDNSIVIVLAIFLILFAIIGTILLSFHIKEKQAIEDGKVSAGFYRDFKGEDYEVVVEQLKALGFTNIKLIELNDAGLFFWNKGEIDNISIGGNSTFESIDYFYPDEIVVISYH